MVKKKDSNQNWENKVSNHCRATIRVEYHTFDNNAMKWHILLCNGTHNRKILKIWFYIRKIWDLGDYAYSDLLSHHFFKSIDTSWKVLYIAMIKLTDTC